jgi:pimeloyl-ACP methyl ester carboxylesterase
MARILRGYVTTPEGQIHYHSGGDGFPLVLLHQNPSSARMWEAVLPGFVARGRQVWAFDTPGYGESDLPPAKPDLPYYARRIVEACDILGLQQFDALGHHTGALIAGIIAADYPGRVRKYVPVGYPLLRDDLRAGLANAKPGTFSIDGAELADYMAGIRFLGGRWLTPHVARRCLIEKLQAGDTWNWAYHAVAAYDDAALARRIAVPTLIVVGRGDPICPDSERAATVIPGAELAVIEDGGVNVADDAPEEFVRIVDEFLAR